MKKNNKGITIIALVITIIVMLILIMVTISYSIRSGLIGKTQEARNSYIDEKEKEEETIKKIEKRVEEETKFDEIPQKYLRYYPCEYIQGTGSQYIDTNVIPSNKTGIDISFCVDSYEPKEVANQFTCFIFGGEKDWKTLSFDFQAGLYGLVYNNKRSGYDITDFSKEDNSLLKGSNDFNKHNVKVINESYYFDNEFKYDLKKINNDKEWQANSSIILFGVKRNNKIQRLDSSKIYSCKIYEDSDIIRNFIPCYYKDNEGNEIIGMYDLLEDKFYENCGSGTFDKGKDIEWKEIIAQNE